MYQSSSTVAVQTFACRESTPSYDVTDGASFAHSADGSPVRLSPQALRVLQETRLFFDLGFPSLAAYADAFFPLRRAESFEHVRVAKALMDLTELREAFAQGRIGWTALKAITRVASADSQAEWLDFV